MLKNLFHFHSFKWRSAVGDTFVHYDRRGRIVPGSETRERVQIGTCQTCGFEKRRYI